jgi:hypothetical protein
MAPIINPFDANGYTLAEMTLLSFAFIAAVLVVTAP